MVGYMNCGTTSGSPFNILLTSKGTINNTIQISQPVSAGYDQSCAIGGTNMLQCWGNGAAGQLGDGDSAAYIASPVTGLTGTPVKVVASNEFTCAMIQGGTVECWGSNASGQMGNNVPGTVQYNNPVASVETLPVFDIAATSTAVCVVTQSGIVQCWGAGNQGQLGNNSTTSSYVPITVYGITNATAIAAGQNHFCALLSTGAVSCWGNNSEGQLGNNSTTASYVAVSTNALSGPATKIVAAYNNTCALLTSGTLECWGDNSSEQLGNLNTSDALVPLTVTGATSVTDVAVGAGLICIVTGGKAKCIGNNGQGQVGNNSGTTATSFSNVSNISGTVLRIASNYYHVCAITNNSTNNVYCWGYNNDGQIGNGTAGAPSGSDATTAAVVAGFVN
jgi:alpha-tubulin suppressor-like RCC1 family protein